MISNLRNKLRESRGDDQTELKPFLEHLEDLRKVVIRSAAALAVGFSVAFPFIPQIVAWLKIPLAPLEKNHPNLIRSGDNIASGFNSAIQIAFWAGLVIASPVILYFITTFVAPALTEKERKVVRQTAVLAFCSMALGLWLGWKYGLPAALVALIWFNDWMNVETWWTINKYISFTTLMLVAFGAVFEIPVVILILGKLGIVSSMWLRKYRRHSIVAALIIAAITTPSPDVASQLLIAVPLIVFYEICIWLIYAHEKKRKAELAVRDSSA